MLSHPSVAGDSKYAVPSGSFVLTVLSSGCEPDCTRSAVRTKPATAPPPAGGASPDRNEEDTRRRPLPQRQPAVTDPHQAQIIADTQKLLKLSQELKAEVAKSNKDTLSLTVIKKAEEVEKLAKTLKEELSKSPLSTSLEQEAQGWVFGWSPPISWVSGLLFSLFIALAIANSALASSFLPID